MHVIAYLRVSGKGQVEGDGFARQAATLDGFCVANDLRCMGVFKEEGVSGTVEGMDRPEFSKAIEFIQEWNTTHNTHIEGIIVERMDRLARDLMVQEFLLRECRERGIQIFSADTGKLEDMASNDVDPTRVLIRQILGALAQWEKANLIAKLAAARNRIKATGEHCEGNVRYGLKPGEMIILHLLMDLRDSGISWRGVAKALNEGGFRTRKGTPWTHGLVYDLYTKYSKESANTCTECGGPVDSQHTICAACQVPGEE